VGDQFIFRSIAQSPEAEEDRIVAQFTCDRCFGDSLFCFPACARDLDHWSIASLHFFGDELQNWLIQSVLANLELGGVNTDGQSTGTSGEIVAYESALMPLIKLPACVERKWTGGDDCTTPQ
jgi:hypothetical protein